MKKDREEKKKSSIGQLREYNLAEVINFREFRDQSTAAVTEITRDQDPMYIVPITILGLLPETSLSVQITKITLAGLGLYSCYSGGMLNNKI